MATIWSLATHGRGFWILDDITPLRQMSAATPARCVLYQTGQGGPRGQRLLPGTPLPPEEPTAKNPPDGAILDYVVPPDAQQVTLEMSDAGGKPVRHFSSAARARRNFLRWRLLRAGCPSRNSLSGEAGMHRFVWDLR